MAIPYSFYNLVCGLVIGFAIALFVVQRGWYDRWVTSRPIRKLLRLGLDDTILVMAHHPAETNRLLPNVAIEDVFALRNVLRVLSELEIETPKIYHPENLSDTDKTKNVISIGGPTRNKFTKQILHAVAGTLIRFDRSTQATDQLEIRIGKHKSFRSASYANATREGLQSRSRDTALLLRIPNPFNPANEVIVIAGIRGIGTWGASDCLRKSAKTLADELRKKVSNPKAGFLAIIDVVYENFDILHTTIRELAAIEKSAISDFSSVGHFYIIQVSPDVHPNRIEIGFVDKYEQFLLQRQATVPTAKVLRAWQCKQSWEMTAIAALTNGLARGSSQDEVFECDELDALLERGEAFFGMLPESALRAANAG